MSQKQWELEKEAYESIEIPAELHTMVRRTIAADRNRRMVQRRARMIRIAGSVAALLFVTMTIGLNSSYAFAKTASKVPVIGTVAKALTVRKYEAEKAADPEYQAELLAQSQIDTLTEQPGDTAGDTDISQITEEGALTVSENSPVEVTGLDAWAASMTIDTLDGVTDLFSGDQAGQDCATTILLAKLEEEKIALYGYHADGSTQGVIVRVGDAFQCFGWTYMNESRKMPELSYLDTNNDGVKELVVLLFNTEADSSEKVVGTGSITGADQTEGDKIAASGTTDKTTAATGDKTTMSGTTDKTTASTGDKVSSTSTTDKTAASTGDKVSSTSTTDKTTASTGDKVSSTSTTDKTAASTGDKVSSTSTTDKTAASTGDKVSSTSTTDKTTASTGDKVSSSNTTDAATTDKVSASSTTDKTAATTDKATVSNIAEADQETSISGNDQEKQPEKVVIEQPQEAFGNGELWVVSIQTKEDQSIAMNAQVFSENDYLSQIQKHVQAEVDEETGELQLYLLDEPFGDPISVKDYMDQGVAYQSIQFTSDVEYVIDKQLSILFHANVIFQDGTEATDILPKLQADISYDQDTYVLENIRVAK